MYHLFHILFPIYSLTHKHVYYVYVWLLLGSRFATFNVNVRDQPPEDAITWAKSSTLQTKDGVFCSHTVSVTVLFLLPQSFNFLLTVATDGPS